LIAGKKPKRPRSQKKTDRLFSGAHSATEQKIDSAVRPFDHRARQMEQKWGVGRLEEIVSPQTAARWGSAMAKLNEAIRGDDVDEVVKRVEVCLRGLDAMDAEATAAGMTPASDAVLVCDDGEGFQVAIMHDSDAWPQVAVSHPDLEAMTPREAAVAVKFYRHHRVGQAVAEVKDILPGTEVVAFRPKQEELEDEIPF